jgi:predicted lipoprotein with Yx(FWY)xxD motif
MIALLGALALVVAACGGDDDGDAATDGATIDISSTDLGDVVVGPSGMTLYLFVPDAQGESTCYDQCATNWPPLTETVSAGAGVDASLLGSAERTDGSTQITYNGWPLYYWANDSAVGDTTGQGVNDVWFVLDAAGEAVSG